MSVPAQVAQDTIDATTDQATSTAAATVQQKPVDAAVKPETKTEETSKTPEAKAEIKFSVKMPEGSLLDAKRADEIVAYAKAQGLSNEQAQSILERESNAVNGYVESQKQTLKSKSAEWVNELMADKDIGGKEFLSNTELAKRVIHRFGDQTLIDGLNETGLGNHPSLVRAFVKIGKLMSEDQLVIAPNPISGGPKSFAERLYNHPTSQTKE